MKLEQLTIKHLDSFITFRNLASEESRYVNAVTPSSAKDLIHKYTLLPNCDSFLLIKNKNVIGEVFLTNKKDKEQLFINSIAVLESYQGTKAASILMDKAFEIAKDNHYKEIALVVRVDNARAIKFYKRYGFQYKGDFHSDDRSDLMEYVYLFNNTIDKPPIYKKW